MLLRIVLGACVLLVFWASTPWARPLILLSGGSDTGSFVFSQALVEVWERPGFSKQEIRWSSELDPRLRLERLPRRQGDLAILDARSAHRLLPALPDLCVLSALWPNRMLMLTSGSNEGPMELLLTPSAIPLTMAWSGLSEGIPPVRMLSAEWPELQAGQILIWMGPPQASQLRQFLRTHPQVQIQVLAPSVRQELLQQFPWLNPGVVPARSLPRQSRNVQTLEQHAFLVSRCDLSSELAQEVLSGIFRIAAWPQGPELFRELSQASNQVYLERYSYHGEARKQFRNKASQ